MSSDAPTRQSTGDAGGLTGFAAARSSGAPLYIQISQYIQSMIRDGRYPVGSLLPREIDMAEAMDVSRQTVRQAVEQLKQLGLISAKKGVGTRVEARYPSAAYQFSLQSLTDVFQYASSTELVVLEERLISARGKMATELGCRSGRQFLYLCGLRQVAGDDRPLCRNDVWIDRRYSSAVRGARVHSTAIFSTIEKAFGETIQEVTQDIRATTLDAAQAELLQARAGDSALRITRKYFGTGRRLVEMSSSTYPAERFSYTIAFKRH